MTRVTNRDLREHIDWGMVSVLVAVVVQTCGIVWWGAGINTRVARLEQDVRPLSAASATVAVLDERTENMKKTLDRVESRLDAAKP